jgi:hypothetical protein
MKKHYGKLLPRYGQLTPRRSLHLGAGGTPEISAFDWIPACKGTGRQQAIFILHHEGCQDVT